MQFLENSISRVSLNLWLHIQSQFTSLRRVMLKDIPLQLVTFQNDKSRREWIYSPPCSIGRTYWKSRFRDNLYTVAFYQKMLDTHGKLRCIHLYYGKSIWFRINLNFEKLYFAWHLSESSNSTNIEKITLLMV